MEYKKAVEEFEARFNDLGLELATNPFAKKLDRATERSIIQFIGQYSQFSAAAIHMLFEARIRTYKWEKLRDELDRNIEEEEGLETGNIPHLEIMREGYLSDFGIDTDHVELKPYTKKMMDSLFELFRNNSNAVNAGALLAFESIAHDEFTILDAITKRHVEITRKPLHKKTRDYIVGHLEFEIGHKEGLRAAIEPYINEHNILEFTRGYAAVLTHMSNWWYNISKDLIS